MDQCSRHGIPPVLSPCLTTRRGHGLDPALSARVEHQCSPAGRLGQRTASIDPAARAVQALALSHLPAIHISTLVHRRRRLLRALRPPLGGAPAAERGRTTLMSSGCRREVVERRRVGLFRRWYKFVGSAPGRALRIRRPSPRRRSSLRCAGRHGVLRQGRLRWVGSIKRGDRAADGGHDCPRSAPTTLGAAHAARVRGGRQRMCRSRRP